MATCANLPADRDPLLLRNERCMEHDREMVTCLLLTVARSVVDWRRRQNLLAFEVYGDLVDAVERVDAADAAYADRVAELAQLAEQNARHGVGAIDPPVTLEIDLLHVHGQAVWHEPVMIVGNALGLDSLYHAIGVAKATGQGSTDAFTADGEGFDVVVVCDDDAQHWNRAQLPYHDADAVDQRPDALSPGARPEVQVALAERHQARAAR